VKGQAYPAFLTALPLALALPLPAPFLDGRDLARPLLLIGTVKACRFR
jgi:hypothetical protein